ncbi:AAA domain-containing protein [Xylariomycetidae sp. FL2044]|nr:AAA domain-containing protein [Xylariomycetidae sp. FL2044]
MATGLVRHLVRQGGYKTTDIALITPYTGQLQKVKSVLSADFEICLNNRDEDIMAAEGFLPEQPEPKPKLGTKLQKRQLVQTLCLATVDNFQGEETKVIIVSLVRANPAHKFGFFKTQNRINVLLSRAQHGMYLIGNTDTYLGVDMWADVHGLLANTDAKAVAIFNAIRDSAGVDTPVEPNVTRKCCTMHSLAL